MERFYFTESNKKSTNIAESNYWWLYSPYSEETVKTFDLLYGVKCDTLEKYIDYIFFGGIFER